MIVPPCSDRQAFMHSANNPVKEHVDLFTPEQTARSVGTCVGSRHHTRAQHVGGSVSVSPVLHAQIERTGSSKRRRKDAQQLDVRCRLTLDPIQTPNTNSARSAQRETPHASLSLTTPVPSPSTRLDVHKTATHGSSRTATTRTPFIAP